MVTLDMSRVENREETMIIFRADGNGNIGSGHIMRCLSIADMARRAGESCTFATAGDEFQEAIKVRGHACVVSHTDYKDMESGLDQLLKMVYAHKPTALFIDSYFVTDKYLRVVMEATCKTLTTLVYIDDVLAFPYRCDILLNYNIYGPDKKEAYRDLYRQAGIREPQFLLGTQYATLREEFQGISPRLVRRNATHVLVSTGGADFWHMGIALMAAICGNKEAGAYTFHVIVGSMNQDVVEIKKLADGVTNIILHSNVQSMSLLMQSCDAAISAAGSTLYELCATQTPTATYVLADNQVPGAEGFEKHGIMRNFGDVRQLGAKVLAQKLIGAAIDLCKDYERRCLISQRQRAIVDGKGAERIVKILQKQVRM